MDILKILFLLIVSLSWLLSQIIRFQLGNGLSLNIFDFVVGGTAIVLLVRSIFKKRFKFYFKDNIGKGIFFFGIVIILSLLWNSPTLTLQQFIISSFYIIRWTLYAFLFFIIKDSRNKDKKLIQRIMLLTGILYVAIGYIQFFYYGELKNLFYLGWDEHKYRLFSVFLDPNFSGIFLVLFLLFIVGKRLQMAQKPLTNIKLLLTVVIAFTVGVLILTFSRTAFLMVFISSAAFFFLIDKKRWLLVVIGIMLVAGVILSQRFYIESVNPFRIFSSNERLMSMKQAVEIFSHQPVLGVGFNAYRYAQLRFGFKKQANIDQSHADAGVDNSFLFVLATTGIVGFISYVIMIFFLLQGAHKVFKQKRQVHSAVIFSSIIGLCIASMFINALFFPPVMLWMWLLLGTMNYDEE